jgi:thiol-disulfide isomerase/thioredoxin
MSLFKRLRLILILLLLTLTACSRPDFHLIDGTKVYRSDRPGQWTVINYWADWCKPCLDEVPELNRFHKELGEQIMFLSVSFDKLSNEELASQQTQFGIEYPIIASTPAPRLEIPRPGALPANYFIAPDGQTFGPVLGPHTAESLGQLLKKKEAEWLASR